MQLPKSFRILLFVATLVLLASPVFAQTAIYRDVAGVQGEATAASHPKTITASAFSFGCANQGGGPQFSELQVSKSVDRSSPVLLLDSAQGTNIATVTLYAQKLVGGVATDYYVIKLTDAKITSVSQSGGLGGTPSESITFQYKKIEIDYTMFNGNQPNGTVVMTWDLTNNQPF